MAAIGHNNPPPDGPYAIMRHGKHKSMGTVKAASRHMTRDLLTLNADPARAHLNQVLIGSDDPTADVADLVPSPNARDENGKLMRRKNSVLAVELMITASPEWWSTATRADQEAWMDASVGWVIQEYGRANVAHLRLHGDEKTGHLTGFVVPLDDNGHLNARRWIGGPDRCSQQQTDYAAAVEHLGLQRGIKGSKATHQRVQSHYADLARPVGKIQIDRPPRVLIDPEGWAAEQRERAEQALAPVVARGRDASAARHEAKGARATARAAEGRAERAEAALEDAKAIAGQMRSLDLSEVLSALGFERHKYDPLKWKMSGHSISIGTDNDAGKWFDHIANRGRGGAIDLVAHVMETDFKQSLAWLADRFGPGATAADVTAILRRTAEADVKQAIKEHPPYTPPAAVQENWQGVRRHLITDRALPARYIDRLHDQGDLYADKSKNAVFVCRNETGTATGAELKGTFIRHDGSKFSGMAPGSRKDAGGFRLGAMVKAAAVYLVESAIDAISLARLLAMDGKKDFAILSAAGSSPEPRSWFASISETAERIHLL